MYTEPSAAESEAAREELSSLGWPLLYAKSEPGPIYRPEQLGATLFRTRRLISVRFFARSGKEKGWPLGGPEKKERDYPSTPAADRRSQQEEER